MNLIILSDTHIKPGQSLLSRIPEELISMIKSSDLIIHAGDFETIYCYNELEALGKLAAVHGDTDSPELMKLLPERKVINVGGINIGVIHKGQLTSENTDGLRYLAKEMGVDVLLSPGSATGPGIAEPSSIELEIKNKTVTGKIIRCKDNFCSYFEFQKPCIISGFRYV